MQDDTFWKVTWKKFRQHRLGYAALYIVLLFCIVGIYAPFLASSKPIFVMYDGVPYFPLFRYLFYRGFYTKNLDIFFNLLIFTTPALCLVLWKLKNNKRNIAAFIILITQLTAFTYYAYYFSRDPASDPELAHQREQALALRASPQPNWEFDLRYMTPYAKLNLLLRYQLRETQQKFLQPYLEEFTKATHNTAPTLWQVENNNELATIKRLEHIPKDSPKYQVTQAQLQYLLDRRQWIQTQSALLHFEIMPLLSHFHWEDDAGGQQALNQFLPWWELTRINRKDLLSALIFGVRISLVVGLTAVALALIIGIPIGALAGYYGGTLDIAVSRLLEIWEAMPIFFMLLMAVAILQSKSIFLVISIIGFFGWTGFSRYIRGEFFKQRNLPYVEACHALGFNNGYIIFKQILPNAIPPVLTLLPFAIMGAITSEAGLSFLGLGEEGSCSWGVLMDEGRSAFPQESYLLWPPAILLTTLLIAIAMVGDSLRDTLDPKMQK